MTLEDGLKLEAKIFGECFTTQDRKIGIDNFMKNGLKVNANFVHSKYPPAKLGALRLLAPQRGLTAIVKESNPPSSPFVKRGKSFPSL
jgi:hypothetical protein